MPRGGSRVRSGPTKTEGSRTSERAGYSLTALPAEGFDGARPDFPLPKRAVYSKEWNEAGKQVLVYDSAETERVAEREIDLWAELWTTPQACAWSMPSQQWRANTIAMYVRKFVLNESGAATAADTGAMLRLADEIGMTDAGMTRMGYKIALDEVAEKRETAGQATTEGDEVGERRQKRLR